MEFIWKSNHTANSACSRHMYRIWSLPSLCLLIPSTGIVLITKLKYFHLNLSVYLVNICTVYGQAMSVELIDEISRNLMAVRVLTSTIRKIRSETVFVMNDDVYPDSDSDSDRLYLTKRCSNASYNVKGVMRKTLPMTLNSIMITGLLWRGQWCRASVIFFVSLDMLLNN